MQSSTSPYADIRKRLYARLIDFIIVFVPLNAAAMLALFFGKSLITALAFLLIEAAYKPFLEMIWGQTIGKMILRIKVVDRATGNNISLNQTLMRFFPWALGVFGTIFLYIRYMQADGFMDITELEQMQDFMKEHVLTNNFLLSVLSNASIFSAVWMISDPLRRALHDRMADTVVVDVREIGNRR